MSSNKWGKIRTSQWHLIHSIRAGQHRIYVSLRTPTAERPHTAEDPTYKYDYEPYEYILTYDGEWLPTARRKWNYGRSEPNPVEETGAKVWEGEGYPKGRVCDRCTSFLAGLENSVEIE